MIVHYQRGFGIIVLLLLYCCIIVLGTINMSKELPALLLCAFAFGCRYKCTSARPKFLTNSTAMVTANISVTSHGIQLLWLQHQTIALSIEPVHVADRRYLPFCCCCVTLSLGFETDLRVLRRSFWRLVLAIRGGCFRWYSHDGHLQRQDQVLHVHYTTTYSIYDKIF